MKKKKLKFLCAALLVLLFAACSDGGDDGGGNEDYGGDDVIDIFTTPAEYRTLQNVAGGTVTENTGSTGAFPYGRTVQLSPYRIAKYETTWELWEEVRTWALENGYQFANAGNQGHEPADTAAPTGTSKEGEGFWTAAQKKTRPVSAITYRDAIVWCNAYSEMSGLQAVYTYNDGVIKDSTNANAAACDDALMDRSRNGYRLPTEAEWENAARGGSQADTTNWAYTYSGGDTVDDVAWYNSNALTSLPTDDRNYGIHPVGTKAANLLGLHDMSGNVFEWCWDRYHDTVTINDAAYTTVGVVINPLGAGDLATNNNRVLRSGRWSYGASNSAVVYRLTGNPTNTVTDQGFRVARSGG